MDTQTESTTTTRPVGIKATYTIHADDRKTSTTTETFDASRPDASEARVGLAVGVEPVKVR